MLNEAEQLATIKGISVVGRGHRSASSAADSVVYAGPQKYKLGGSRPRLRNPGDYVSDDVVAQIRRALGLPSAPLVNRSVEATVLFFTEVLQTDPLQWTKYLRGIAFSTRSSNVSCFRRVRASPASQYGPSTRQAIPLLYTTRNITVQHGHELFRISIRAVRMLGSRGRTDVQGVSHEL